jgi:NADPH-dependent glutamate synthase beta subunit-like oxidoreductase
MIVSDGVATGLETMGVRSVFDDLGRFAPVFDHDDLSYLEADTVILAIGQSVDVEALGSSGPELTPQHTIAVDGETLATTLPNVWAGGDAAHGPRNLIDAVADGRPESRFSALDSRLSTSRPRRSRGLWRNRPARPG